MSYAKELTYKISICHFFIVLFPSRIEDTYKEMRLCTMFEQEVEHEVNPNDLNGGCPQ